MTLNYTLRDSAPHSSGLHIHWNADGTGVSEAYASFLLKARGEKMEVQVPYYVNVSTRLHIEGSVIFAKPNTIQVTVECQLFNEEQAALAKSLTFYYRESAEWTIPGPGNNCVVIDCGNGTYRATFALNAAATSVDISAHVLDERDVFVQANVTCT